MRRGRMVAEVPLAPLQEAFRASGLSNSALARAVGTDESRIRRTVGGRPTPTVKRLATGELRHYVGHCNAVPYDFAVRLARGMGLDPVDVGL